MEWKITRRNRVENLEVEKSTSFVLINIIEFTKELNEKIDNIEITLNRQVELKKDLER